MGQEELKEAIRNDDNTTLRFQKGENLFMEGDPGGDLYLIEHGEVEVYRQRADMRVHLTDMGPGELIGLFTCLNDNARTASVIAKTGVRCRIIRHKKIKDAIGNLPKWFSIVLKEYNIRLNEVEEMLVERNIAAFQAEADRFSGVTEGRLFCTALMALAPQHIVLVEQEEFVLLADILAAIAETLGAPEDRIQQICQIFLDSGLLLKSIEPDKKAFTIPLSHCQKIADFPHFINLARSGKSKRMVDSRWPSKAIKLGRGLAKYAQAKNQDTNQPVTFSLAQLNRELKKLTGAEISEEGLGTLESFLLIKSGKEGGEPSLTYHPQNLGRTIALVMCFQKLKAFANKGTGQADAA